GPGPGGGGRGRRQGPRRRRWCPPPARRNPHPPDPWHRRVPRPAPRRSAASCLCASFAWPEKRRRCARSRRRSRCRCRGHRIASRPCGSSHPKCARTIAAELLEAIARRKILATVAMGSAIFGLLELIASPSDAGGSLTPPAVLVRLAALGLAGDVACLELLGVARVHALPAAVRRLCAGLAPAPRVMASGGAIGEGIRHGLQGAGVFRRAADRQ